MAGRSVELTIPEIRALMRLIHENTSTVHEQLWGWSEEAVNALDSAKKKLEEHALQTRKAHEAMVRRVRLGRR